MSRNSKKKDTARLREIVETLTEPFKGLDHLNTEDKFYMAMNPEGRPIYRRKIITRLKVYGLWWLHESQWTRFLSPIHTDATVVKSGEDPDRVLASRTLDAGGWCYIREIGDRVDIEAIGKTKKWDPVKKKSFGTAYEWLTVSITREAFEELDSSFGPVHSGCKH